MKRYSTNLETVNITALLLAIFFHYIAIALPLLLFQSSTFNDITITGTIRTRILNKRNAFLKLLS